MRTITLELLRHGPAHNQLLSPLTNYLALCENHSAVSLQVPFEHNQMMYRLRALSYILSHESRDFQLTDTARMMGELFAQIPGLTADLDRNTQTEKDDSDNITHLRLILSSSELALLPFELALAPKGFPGAGQYLSLQPHAPVCITRETRRIADECMVWPKHPKILFVFASPYGLEAVPAQAHLLALRQAITPWLALSDDLSLPERNRLVAENLGVLSNATVAKLEEACATGGYTHIHILAHGVSLDSAYDNRFGLAFHSDIDPSGREVVSGERLATIMRTPSKTQSGRFSRPAVVTLASCNSSNVGSVAGVGASIAHALHDAGIPMVIASQFPLSFGGSVMLVQDLYSGLLWGDDPRKLLVGLRRRLHSYFKETHDWASLTAYTSLPPDFDKQLVAASIAQANRAIDAALRNTDRVLHNYVNSHKEKNDPAIVQARMQVVTAKQHLHEVMHSNPEQQCRIYGQLASTTKREAQMQFHALGRWSETDVGGKNAIFKQLDVAREYYRKADQLERVNSWALVQYLSLTLLLLRVNYLSSKMISEQDILALWLSAEIRTKNAIDIQENTEERAWYYSYLAELYLLAPLVNELDKLRPHCDFGKDAVHAACMIVKLTGGTSLQVALTRRQISRYKHWLGVMSPEFKTLEKVVDELLKVLPNNNVADVSC